MKYIILSGKIGTTVREVPFIFPEFMVHAHMVAVASALLKHPHCMSDVKVVSAGEIQFTAESCHGGSTSIKPAVISREQTDTNLINTYPYLHGIVA